MKPLKLVAKKRWWVNPLLSVVKVLVYARIVRNEHFNPLAGFIARFGFNFKTER